MSRDASSCCDYLNKSSTLRQVDEEDRTKMVEWCYSVIDTCELETITLAMEMVDRFISKSSDVSTDILRDRIQFQLLTMTALYVANKINTKPALRRDFIPIIFRDLYPVKEIEAMELILMKELS